MGSRDAEGGGEDWPPAAACYRLPMRLRPILIVGFAHCVLGGCYLSHGRGEPFEPPSEDAAPDTRLRPLDATPDTRLPPDDACVGEGCDALEVLDGLRWELPCGERPDAEEVCVTATQTRDERVAGGVPGARYAVTVRFRGVVELAEYLDGDVDGHFVVGGAHYGGAWNSYALHVDSPRQSYFLNQGTEGLYHCVAIDYTKVIEVDAGSRVRLIAESIEERQITNRDLRGEPIVVDGVAPAPDAYDGQFIEMDVVAVRRLR